MSRVREVTPKVMEMLKEHPATRSNDRLLIREIYTKCYGVNPYAPFGEVVMRNDLPSFESIRRARQKVQEYCENLRAEEPVESMRIEEQREYIEYSQESV
jgi:hypothetical protein